MAVYSFTVALLLPAGYVVPSLIPPGRGSPKELESLGPSPRTSAQGRT